MFTGIWCPFHFQRPFKTPVWKILLLAKPYYCRCLWLQALSVMLMETFWSGYLSIMAPSLCVGKADAKKNPFVFQGRKGHLGPVGFLLPFPVRLTQNGWTRWKLCFPLTCLHGFSSFWIIWMSPSMERDLFLLAIWHQVIKSNKQ